MKIIQLPPILTDDLNLAALNQQLRDRTAQLDWSSVVSVSDQVLTVLLAGLDPSDHADVIGDSTLSDAVAIKVAQVLQDLPAQPQTAQPTSLEPTVTPALWQPAREGELGSAFEEQNEGPENWIQAESIVEMAELHSQTASEPPILKIPSPYQIRVELEQAVLADLLGPAAGEYEEVDEPRVSDRYLVGLLAPLHRRSRLDQPDEQLEQSDELASAKTGTVDEAAEQLDDLAVGGTSLVEDGTPETTNPAVETMFPSSLGLSFCVSGTASAIRIKAGWGQYERTKSEYLETPTGAAKTVWRRYPIVNQSAPIPLTTGSIDPWRIDVDREVYVRGQIRPCGDDWMISLFLINEQREPDRSPDQAWMFQPELSVESADPGHPDIFIRKAQQRSLGKLDPVQ